jgi:hypothetical protein
MRSSTDHLYSRLHRLTNAELEPFADPRTVTYFNTLAMARNPGLSDWLRFKATITETYSGEIRQAIDSVSDGKEFALSVFPPPLSLLAGIDFGTVAHHADSIDVKLFTMHWPTIVSFYASELLEHNRNSLDVSLLTRAISNVFDMEDNSFGSSLEDYAYPGPEKPHRAGTQAQLRKIRQVVTSVSGQAQVLPVVHGYGPLSDFQRRLRIGWDSGCPGIWINRYCYLGATKLRSIKQLGNGRK